MNIPAGFRCAAVHAGIKASPDKPDLALIVSDRPASAAGVFTQNRVCAAPVKVSRERVPAEGVRGIVVCAGNANACTGRRGLEDARRMAAVAAAEIGCRPEDILVCSTGVIGVPLPMAAVEAGIRKAAARLAGSPQNWESAARAMMTTDTQPKVVSHNLALARGSVNVLGLAKGAAMIGPHLATMLAFIVTDAGLPAHRLQELLRAAADVSFNCLSVEGHTSTNDTVLVLANGAAQGEQLTEQQQEQMGQVLTTVCQQLAEKIAADAEGAQHLVHIEVQGLASFEEARHVARTIANSVLVKTALFGGDPNWGRIVSAVGFAGVPIQEEELAVWIDDVLVFWEGEPQPFDRVALSRQLRDRRVVTLRVQCGRGPAACHFWTSDLTYDYVRLNAEYTT